MKYTPPLIIFFFITIFTYHHCYVLWVSFTILSTLSVSSHSMLCCVFYCLLCCVPHSVDLEQVSERVESLFNEHHARRRKVSRVPTTSTYEEEEDISPDTQDPSTSYRSFHSASGSKSLRLNNLR
uniref:Uncharacterized protein n=1 Tax=Cacopsylla melanoneura TaxID=428564 RepID=A0A8D8YQ61_9HEMI